MNEDDDTFVFDKFMESIIVNEESKKLQQAPEQEKTDARKYVEKYRELPQNRTVYRK